MFDCRIKTYGIIPCFSNPVSGQCLGKYILWQKPSDHYKRIHCDFHSYNSNSRKCMLLKWLLFSKSGKRETIEIIVNQTYFSKAFNRFQFTARQSLNLSLLNNLLHISFAADLISSVQTSSSPSSLLTSLSHAFCTRQASTKVEVVCSKREKNKFL